MGLVIGLYQHPVKGLAPLQPSSVLLRADFGMEGDRAYALLFEELAAVPEGHCLPWLPKKSFAMQHDWPALARVRFSVVEHRMHLEIDGKLVIDADLAQGDHEARQRIATAVASFLQRQVPYAKATHPEVTPLRLVGDGATTRYPDRVKHHVSLLNQSTLGELGTPFGATLDARRFRGNLVVSGFAPWEEQSWLGREIRVGQALLRVDKEIARCANVDVNPDDGVIDLPVLRTVAKSPGRGSCGVIATVLEGGRVQVGQTIELLPP